MMNAQATSGDEKILPIQHSRFELTKQGRESNVEKRARVCFGYVVGDDVSPWSLKRSPSFLLRAVVA